jgi:hypothetical protein
MDATARAYGQVPGAEETALLAQVRAMTVLLQQANPVEGRRAVCVPIAVHPSQADFQRATSDVTNAHRDIMAAECNGEVQLHLLLEYTRPAPTRAFAAALAAHRGGIATYWRHMPVQSDPSRIHIAEPMLLQSAFAYPPDDADTVHSVVAYTVLLSNCDGAPDQLMLTAGESTRRTLPRFVARYSLPGRRHMQMAVGDNGDDADGSAMEDTGDSDGGDSDDADGEDTDTDRQGTTGHQAAMQNQREADREDRALTPSTFRKPSMRRPASSAGASALHRR